MSAPTKLAFARGLYGVAGLFSLVFLAMMARGLIQGYYVKEEFLKETDGLCDLAVHTVIDVRMTLLMAFTPFLLATLAWWIDPARGRHWLGKLSGCLVLLFSVAELALTWFALRAG